MSEQEERVLRLCRYWYQTASDISRQTLWYEIGVMLENENAAQQSRALDLPNVTANHCVPVNGVHAIFCTGHEPANQ